MSSLLGKYNLSQKHVVVSKSSTMRVGTALDLCWLREEEREAGSITCCRMRGKVRRESDSRILFDPFKLSTILNHYGTIKVVGKHFNNVKW